MGTGALDAKRALKQLSAGEFHSFQVSNAYTEVPVIGWDYGRSDARGSNFPSIYRLNQQLPAGSFISITLTFDRTVTKSGVNGIYHSGDTFSQSADPFGNPGYDQYTDLDLYLLPKNSFDISDAIAESVDNTGTVDHIFFQIPNTGEYEFWVDPFNNTKGAEDYAVAWWADGIGALTSGAGDLNQDGHVDANDIVAMEKALANEAGFAQNEGLTMDQLALIGDVNGDGVFNNADIQALINLLQSGGGSTSVPEPASFMLLAFGGLLLIRRSRRQGR
jgi:MYXO-CTERM domain-containing protein